MTKRLVVIDGKSVFYRGYYAMPNLSLADGTPTGGVYGFASLAIEIIKKLKPDYVAVAWDKAKTNIRSRREIYPEYKAGRKPAPADFYEQIPILHELLDAFGWPLYEIDDYEADDILGAFAQQAAKEGIETDIVTSDLDALQLVNGTTKVYALKSGLANIEEFDVAYLEKKYGITIDQLLDLKALKGDSSDNLPGVPGIGEKTAVTLLQEYKTLDAIYDNIEKIKPATAKKLQDGKELAYITKKVGKIWTDAPVILDFEAADINNTDLSRVAAELKKLEFSSLLKRLPKHMQEEVQTALFFESEIHIKEVNWPENIQISGAVVLHIEDDELWVSFDRKTVSRKKILKVPASFWTALEFAIVVSHDTKLLYHQLDAQGIKVKFGQAHDIHQAAFLINPLRRDRSLESLAGGELDSTISRIEALWQIYDWQIESFSQNPKLQDIAQKFDFPLSYHLFMMEKRGITIDTALLKSMSKEFRDKLSAIETQMHEMAGYEFNIASPSQLSEVLFTKLQLPTAGIKKGKTSYSTGQKELDKLRGQHPIVELIEQSRELAKLKNTYVDALPLLVDAENRLHTTFNQDVAATGRLSSTNPNLQNIPVRSDEGKRIRAAFIPAKGNVFVSADYSQFELRLAAELASDQQLIEDFNGDIDIHTKTASEVYEIPIGEVTKKQRYDAKAINFGVLYGMSPHGLVAATGMSFGDAKKFIDHYFELRAPIKKFIDDTINQAKTVGYVETLFGRRRPTPDAQSSNFMVRQAAERAAANMPIQGTEADLMKLAMIAVDEKIAGLGEQILQVHDSILVECSTKNADKVADILKQTMENVYPKLHIKLQVDVSVGNNWSEL